VTIAGGGLAGLTLGLLLRRADVPVEIWDAGTYPRHRVCGEFISGRGVDILDRLGLPAIPEQHGLNSRSVRFFHTAWSSPVFSLPEPALSIDRATLDHALATEFRKAGGDLRENQRWTERYDGEGLVRATGRRAVTEGPSQFIGFKVHARNVPLSADLELHFSDQAYVGLSRQRDGTANICGLFKKTASLRNYDLRSGEIFKRVVSGGACGPLAEAMFDMDSFSAVAGISLRRETSQGTNECRIGDSICMIAPLTGNGMSVALESATIAAPFLRDYSRGLLNWDKTRAGVSQSCNRHFRRRFFSASVLQNAAFTCVGRRAMMYFLETMPSCFRLWFWLTR
jgi:menaquinone-9 beta-reductase